jgi:acyl dehydratase
VALSASSLKVGDSRTEVVVENLSRTQIVQYAGASGDYNPLHSDEVYVTKVAGYPTVFAHGMLTMGLTARVLTDWAGDGRLLSYGVRFEKQVWPGDTLTATATVESIEDGENGENGKVASLSVVTVNEAGDRVLSGTASARLDP